MGIFRSNDSQGFSLRRQSHDEVSIREKYQRLLDQIKLELANPYVILTRREAAKLCGVYASKIQRWVKESGLKERPRGIRMDELMSFLIDTDRVHEAMRLQRNSLTFKKRQDT